KIADFGVAASITGQTSMVLGTTKYMAPELFTGEGTIDGRVDMYSLGFIAYEMLAGREKFKEVFSEVVRDPHTESLRWMKWHSDKHVQAPALNEVNPVVPVALARIVAKMMVKEPSERYESMEALGRDIKDHFSPRVRAEAGVGAAAAPLVAQPVEDEAHAAAGGEGPAEQEPVVVAEPSPEGPATAALPKRAIPLKTKLILAGCAFVLVMGTVLGLLIYRSVQRGKELSAAETLFKQGWDAFDDDRNYKKAQETLTQLRATFPGTPEAAKASVILCLCKGYKAVMDHDWQAAQEHEKAATDRLNDVQAGAVESSDLYKWTQGFKDKDYIRSFRDYRITAWEFRDRLSRAQDLLAEGNYKAALDEVRKFDRSGVELPEAFRKELRDFKAKVALARFRSDCSNEISKGDGLVAEGNLDKAKLAYQNAKALLEGKEGRVLPKKERDDLLKSLAAKLKSVETRGRYEDAIASAKEARKDGDKVGEMAALQRAYKIKPSPELEARIKSLRSQVDMARARDLLDKGNNSAAIKVLKQLLGYDPNNSDAKALLNGLERRANGLAVLSEAHRLYRKGKYAEALAKYDEAAALLPPDATVKERMVDCRYRIKVAEAERLRHADKLAEAIKAYEEARIIRPDKDSWLSSRQGLCSRKLQYRQYLEAGDAAQKDKNWKRALAEYGKAQRIKDGPEIKARISITKYSRFVALGRAALSDGDPKSAKAYFNRAKAIMDTEEIRKLIAHADKLMRISE
ncbi:MAG: tetratricopeptide repeat protein, partial [Phycisphaerae bacterium]|nr:tetratricopeptide repeat protein [Phycisphaerae bacterium]